MPETPREKADRLGVPLIESFPSIPRPGSPPYDPVVSVCGKCGLELRQVMGYVCSKPGCPTGLGGATC